MVLTALMILAARVIFGLDGKNREAERDAPSPSPVASQAIKPPVTAEPSRLALRVEPDAERAEIAEPDTEPEPCGCPPDWFTIPRQDNEQPEPELRLLGEYQVYGYDVCPACCGKTDGITASGAAATVGRTVACNALPLGTQIYIDGIGERVVEDRGGMADGVIDVLCADHAECYAVTGVYQVYEIYMEGERE